MAKILYTANNADGKSVHGFVDADDAQEARNKLLVQGLSNIKFHQEMSVSEDPSALHGLSEKQSADLAKFKLELMMRPGLSTVLKESFRRLKWLLALDAAAFAWGAWTQNACVAALAALLAAYPFAKVAWLNRHADQYEQLLRSFAMGQWSQVRESEQKLRSAIKLAPMLEFDLDIRLACIQAREGRLAQALEGVEHWRSKLVDKAALCECRIAAVHASGGDRDGFVQAMDRAYGLSDKDPSRGLDLALAHARVGDLEQAKTLLDGLDEGLLPEMAKPFASWARGLCQMRSKDPASVQTLAQAVEGFMEKSHMPAAWTAMAFCVSDHALALAAHGQAAQAKREVDGVWGIVGAHADAVYLSELSAAGLAPS